MLCFQLRATGNTNQLTWFWSKEIKIALNKCFHQTLQSSSALQSTFESYSIHSLSHVVSYEDTVSIQQLKSKMFPSGLSGNQRVKGDSTLHSSGEQKHYCKRKLSGSVCLWKRNYKLTTLLLQLSLVNFLFLIFKNIINSSVAPLRQHKHPVKRKPNPSFCITF